jgi:hypothetical protein
MTLQRENARILTAHRVLPRRNGADGGGGIGGDDGDSGVDDEDSLVSEEEVVGFRWGLVEFLPGLYGFSGHCLSKEYNRGNFLISCDGRFEIQLLATLFGPLPIRSNEKMQLSHRVWECPLPIDRMRQELPKARVELHFFLRQSLG